MSDAQTCSCGAQCRTHGIITAEDRAAAFTAGYQAGMAEGRLQAIADEVAALTEASALLEWVKVRTLAFVREGAGWADMVAGPKPGGGRHE